MPVAPQRVRFGRWLLDAPRRTLYADGVAVALNGRGFDLLAFLVARHGQPVSRDEIFAHVWPGITVGENNLSVQISSLRKILGEGSAAGPGLIVTVPGRGYSFTGEVSAETSRESPAPMLLREIDLPSPDAGPSQPALPAASNAATGRWGTSSPAVSAALGLVLAVLLLGSAAALFWRPAPPVPRLSIAVLPLRNLSSDREKAYLADALTDDLTCDLAHIPGSIVTARTSAEAYQHAAMSVEAIGHALRVRYLVDGSLTFEQGRYYVSIGLIDAANGHHLWTSRLPPIQGRLFEVRNALVRQLSVALGFEMEQIESARSISDRPDDPDATDLFLRARAILDWDTSLPGLHRAQAMLENAIEQQPRFGDALAQLGSMLLTKVHDMDDPDADKDYAEALEMIKRALEVSPRNALALAAHGRALTFTGRWTEASFSANAALKIEPSCVEAEAVLAKSAQAQGYLDDAVEHIEAIFRLMPNSPLNKTRYVTLGLIYLVKGETEAAMKQLHEAIAGEEDSVPTEGLGRVEVTKLLLVAGTGMLGRSADARKLYEDYRTNWPNRTEWRFAALFDKSYTRMPGFQRMMTALENAGMPVTADEHAPPSSPSPACPGTAFDETPAKLAHGRTLDTDSVSALLKLQPPPLLIDLGDGIAQPPGAVLYRQGEVVKPAEVFALDTARQHNLDAQTVIIVMGSGAYGCTSFLAATSLLAHGYKNTAWYRGGEEAWAAAGKSSTDGRPE